MNHHKLDGMLLATLLTTIFYSSTYPYIHKQIMTVASDSIIAFEQIVNCVSIILCGCMWNRGSDFLFKFYPLFCILETVIGIMTTIYVLVSGNVIAYYILDMFAFAIVTRNIICGGTKLRAMRYNSESKREHFDNNDKSMSAIATIIGSLIAMKLELNFNIMICVATFGNAIDNIFYIVIYRKTIKGLK